MDDYSLLMVSLSQLAVRAPMLIAYAVAIGLAVVRWEKHPQVSMLVVIAVAVLALEMIAGTILFNWLPMRMRESGRTASEIGVIFGAWGVVNAAIAAGCWGMLIAAIFGWRDSRAPRA